MRLALILAMSVGLLAGCQPPPSASLQVDRAEAPAGTVLLQGRVVFPGFALRATSADIQGQATVSLIDATGVTRAAGVTDADGNFTLYQSTTAFTATEGAFYHLDVLKRIGTTTSADVLTLRTLLKRGADDWDSITGGTVIVNLTTTAIAMIEADDDAVAPADVMGKAPDGTTVAAFGAYNAARVTGHMSGLTARLDQDLDPTARRPIVWTGSVTLTDQASVDNLAHVEAITGSLTLSTSLEAISLPNLRRINGDLIATGMAATSVSLPNLQEVTGDVTFESNSDLPDLDGLGSLKTIGGTLKIIDNAVLTSAAGLTNLESLGVDLHIRSNPTLAQMSFDGLSEIPGDLWLTGNGHVTDGGFTDMQGFSNLTTVGGELWVYLSRSQTSFSGLERLSSVGGKLDIHTNPKLATLEGLSGLKTVGAQLRVINNSVLTDVSALSGLTSVSADTLSEIIDNDQLPQASAEALVTELGLTNVDVCGNENGPACP